MICKNCNSENIYRIRNEITEGIKLFCADCGRDVILSKEEKMQLCKEQQAQKDPVNNPAHYTDGKIEVIDFIEDKQLGFHLGNAIKYICRAGKKDPEKTSEDLEKAIWYIRRHIKSLWED